MRRRHELSEQEWAAVEPLLPGRDGDPGRTAADNRLFVNAVLFVAKTGVPWRDLPPRASASGTASGVPSIAGAHQASGSR